MKLLRFGEKGYEQPGLIDTTGVTRDLSTRRDDICGPVLAPEMLDELRRLSMSLFPDAGAYAVSECAQALRDVMFVSSEDNSPG